MRDKLNYRFFIRLMLLTLVLIGLLQFFEFPKVLDYILLGLAVVLGAIGGYKKFQE